MTLHDTGSNRSNVHALCSLCTKGCKVQIRNLEREKCHSTGRPRAKYRCCYDFCKQGMVPCSQGPHLTFATLPGHIWSQWLSDRWTVHLLLVILLSGFLPQVTGLEGIFPPVQELSKSKPINATSTCGITRELSYCISYSSVETCTLRKCLLECCSSCGSQTPSSLQLGNGARTKVTESTDLRPSSPLQERSLVFSNGSNIVISSLDAANIPAQGFSITAWIKQDNGNSGFIIHKGLAYSLSVTQSSFEFLYTTKDAPQIVRTVTLGNMDNAWGRWFHVALVVYAQDFAVFLNGELRRSQKLVGIINDKKESATLGNTPTDDGQFSGLMQDVRFYGQALTNREVMETLQGVLPSVYGYSHCRCPPSHPKISPVDSFFCIKNEGNLTELAGRLSEYSHPPEYAVDQEVVTHWISELVEEANITIDLVYEKLQVYVVQLQFYSPPPQGILIERSLDEGQTYLPWQYYATDCMKIFNIPNNGPLAEPDSVNCLTLSNPKPTWEIISFQTQEPGPEDKPQRPFGTPGCKDFHCSEKLLEFVRATNVRIRFLGHTLVTNANHKYFGLRKILVGGSCDCYGHAKACSFYERNSTHLASYTCQCDSRTFTMGDQCQFCLPLYRDKPLKRGTVLEAYPCKKCQCYDHADSCTYDSTLDTDPNNRTSQGGGVCVNCKHNTEGRFCDRCKTLFYRPQGKDKSAEDACVLCECIGPGVLPGQYDCQKDDSKAGVLAGQCQCKQLASGRQCMQCKDGYFNLTVTNPDGCSPCNCFIDGTEGGSVKCDISTGQCSCKKNVDPSSVKCTACKKDFYGLSASNPDGCSACSCNSWGSQSPTCNIISGQCVCKSTTEGRRCDTCKDGYFGLSQTGCQTCRCDDRGSDPSFLSNCNKENGQCKCKELATGIQCDQCKAGYYGLSKELAQGCKACNCDQKGTIEGSLECDQLNGTCRCKGLVRGQQCNLCAPGAFNLSKSNEKGCILCNCYPKGTVDGDRISAELLPCSSTGSCSCYPNVVGPKCDSCMAGFYWNPTGSGCVACQCDAQGAQNTNCNSTGFCTCREGVGVGGQRCDSCLPGFFGFSSGRCAPCGCSQDGSLSPECDTSGRCLRCKVNVEGLKCNVCKPGTKDLMASNPFGCSGVPSQQSGPRVINLGPRAFLITWKPPENPNGFILYYLLYRNDTLVYNGTALSLNDTGLVPFTVYNYYIVSVTAGGTARSVDSDVVYRTLPDKPEGVLPPTFTDIRERSVVVSWQTPTFPNGIISRYIVRAVDHSNTPGIVYSGTEFSKQVTGLSPFTVYNFTLEACTSAGCTASQLVAVSTRSAAPESQPAPYVTPLPGGVSAYVFWDPPDQPNGRILFYNLFIRMAPFVGEGTTVSTKLDAISRNYTVTNLIPYTRYQFRVVSFTSQVKGDTSSNWTDVKTLEAVPAGEEAMSPRAVSMSSTSVNVSWSLPGQPNGVITSYKVYRYDKTSDFKTPILSSTTANNVLSAVISDLMPYTEYFFSIIACNSIGCTTFSPRGRAMTLASAPAEQGQVNITIGNGSSLLISWPAPRVSNGPLTLQYSLHRKLSAFSFPPPIVETGIRFPASDFFQFSGSLFPSSAYTRLEFWFRTYHTQGLILYAASSDQSDIIAVTLKAGVPVFHFDASGGATSIPVQSNTPLNDGKWHTVLVTRDGKQGTITVDNRFTGQGTSSGSNEVIATSSHVFFGGVPPYYKVTWKDQSGVALPSLPFHGCLKDVKVRGNNLNFAGAIGYSLSALLHEHCPSNLEKGVRFKGEGFLSLPNYFPRNNTYFTLSFRFKTRLRDNVIFFCHGSGSTPASFLALVLHQGRLLLSTTTATEKRNETLGGQRDLCDGNWHSVSIVSVTSGMTIQIDSETFVRPSLSKDLDLTSRYFLGGFPIDSVSVQTFYGLFDRSVLRGFGGCLSLIGFTDIIDVQSQVIEHHNVDFDGCPTETGNDSCTLLIAEQVYSGSNLTHVETGLKTFTEYLYQVNSYRPGVDGFAESVWRSTRTGEGAPGGLSPPIITLVAARHVEVRWASPTVSGGLVVKYELVALPLNGDIATLISIPVDENLILKRNISNLSPYTSYNVSLRASTVGGSTSSDPVAVETKQAEPEGVLSPVVVPLPTALNVSWRAPSKPNGIILFYQLEVDSNIKYTGLGFNVFVEGLNVYTKYSLRLVVCNGAACSFIISEYYTAQLPPEGMLPPSLQVLGSKRLSVSWKTPLKVNGVIVKYEILLATEDISNKYQIAAIVPGTAFSYTLTNLTAGTLYFVKVTAFTNGGGATSNSSFATTEESAPEDIPPPKAVPTSPHTINVTILEPRIPNGVIITYALFEDGKLVQNSTLKTFIGKGYLPYSRHTFYIRAYTVKGFGQSDETVVFTLDATPVGVIVLAADVLSSTTFRANWSSVETPNGILTYRLIVEGEFYEIGLSSGERVDYRTHQQVKLFFEGTNDNKYKEFSGLLPYANYTARVNASNRAGSIASNHVSLTTPGTVPFGVRPPNVTTGNATMLFLSWVRPGRANGIILKYELIGKYPQTLFSNTSDISTITSGMLFNYEIHNLLPNNLYEFRIKVFNTFGSTESQWTKVMMPEYVPERVDPPKIKQIESRSVFIEIPEPVKPNGNIIRYVIYVNDTEQNTTRELAYWVRDLLPFTVYSLSISACTKVGCTQSLSTKPFRTLEDVPENQPPPTLQARSSRSVLITWQAPQLTNGIIRFYRIERKIKGQIIFSEIASVNATSGSQYIDSTVKPWTTYDFRVIAWTSVGGTPSPSNSITMPEGDPEGMAAPTTTPASPSSINVSWSAPTIPNGVVTHYYVVVGQMEYLVNSTLRFTYIVNGLQAYEEYDVIIKACTRGGCGSSPMSKVRTLPTAPRGQLPPTAETLSSTSLSVRWPSPLLANGPIQSYILERRTLEDPVSLNQSRVGIWYKIFQGLGRSFEDNNLGIFSVQQYRVTVVTSMGNSTSNFSLHYRTAPDVPLGGVTVTATPASHTTVNLTWILPSIHLLRGEPQRFTITYQLVGSSAVNQFTTIGGDRRSVAVTGLLPSTNYSFRVKVYNGAGEKESLPSTARTLDGAPEGFDPPSVSVKSATEVRLEWRPPRVPNGNVVNYSMVFNGKKFDTVPGTTTLHVQGGLKPFTDYAVQVEVCTVYACLTSGSTNTRTDPAGPQNLEAPSLEALSSSTIRVTWGTPRDENGIMIGYQLFRRKISECPKPPTPKRKCTYIECPVSMDLCGTQCYNPKEKQCCSGVLHELDPTKSCCETNYMKKNAPSDVCCGGQFYRQQANYQCCFRYYVQVSSGYQCCLGDSGVVVGIGDSCCGGVPYNVNGSQSCICNQLFTKRSPPIRKCCGGFVVAIAQECCGDEVTGVAYDFDSSKKCCGTHYIERDNTICCKDDVGAVMAYNGTTTTAKCCGLSKIGVNESCCTNTSYNKETDVCADKSSFTEFACGKGTVCPIKQAASAYCDRCDFNPVTMVCGAVQGYYNPTQTRNTTVENCYSDYVELLKNAKDSSLRTFDDSGLEPHTQYEYYVVAINTVGNVSSLTSVGRALMAKPEGLSRPVPHVISDAQIAITWDPPSQPNGVISAYKLYRIDWKTKTEILVFSGIKLSYTDDGLLPNEGYLYRLSVCTSLCANITALSVVYTRQAKPENVLSPVLTAISPFIIQVNWSEPNTPNGIIVRYNASMLVNGSFFSILSPTDSGLSLSAMVFGLVPYTSYTFRISACTVIGCSTGPSASILTLEAPPQYVQPPYVYVLDSRTVEVEWRVPAVMNGRLRYYLLYRGNIVVYNGTLLTYRDYQVSPNTHYVYIVEAFTYGGGRKSGPANVTTPESTPEGIAPPSINPLSFSALFASWTAPSRPNGIITHYNIIYSKPGMDRITLPALLRLNLTISGLDPFTQYEVRVEACTIKGCGSSNKTIGKTLEAPPSGQDTPILQAKGPSVVDIKWKPPRLPNGVVVQYEVIRREGTDALQFVIYIGPLLEYIDTGLKAFTTYQYKLRARNSVGATESSWASVTTGEAPPSGMDPPKVLVISGTTVHVSWEQPSNPNGVILSYEVGARLFSTPEQQFLARCCIPNTVFNVSVSNLTPSTSYEFRVVAVNSAGRGFSGWTVARTTESPPSGLPSLQADQNPEGRDDGTVLKVFWDPPLQSNGIITRYTLYMDKFVVYQGSQREAIIRRLSPYQKYSFQLEVCNSAGCTKGVVQVLISGEAMPSGQIPPSFGTVSATSVSLIWKSPINSNGKILRYEVHRQQASLARRRRSTVSTVIYSVNGTNASLYQYKDDGVRPYRAYEYKIRAINSVGAVDSEWVRVTTAEGPPSGVWTPNLTATAYTVTVQWNPPRELNGIIRLYEVFRNRTSRGLTSGLSFVDQGLSPATVYFYAIQACTSGGCSLGDSSFVTTENSAPGSMKPPLLTPVSSRSIRAEWEPPQLPNGIVQSYQLRLIPNEQPVYEGLVLQHTVLGLQPFTAYSFTVAACTQSACTRSGSSTTRTNEAPPESLSAPIVIVRGAREVEIVWTAPVRPYGVISHYILNRDSQVIYNGTDLRFVDRTVLPGTRYGYSVIAFNGAGSATSDVTFSQATSPSAPENISAPILSVLSSTSLTAAWSPPGQPNGIIDRYYLLYSGQELLVGKVTAFEIVNLTPFTLYGVRVKACTQAGCSSGPEATARTKEAAPTNQSAPTYDSAFVYPRSIRIQWQPPLIPNGVILKYQLQRQQGSEVTLVYSGPAVSFTDASTAIQPNERYDYRVTSFNSAGSVTSVWSVVSTKIAPPEDVLPISVAVEDIHPTSFVFYIIQPRNPYGTITSYSVEIIDVRNISMLLQVRGEVNSLTPATPYRTRLKACNAAGCGYSPIKVVFTLPSAPSGFNTAPQISSRTDSSLYVSWEAPSLPNGALKWYVLLVRYACPQPTLPEVRCSAFQRVVNSSLDTSFNLTGLKPFSEYYISVRVQNVAGVATTGEVKATTLSTDPIVLEAPKVSVDGNTVTIDWSLCFDLQSQLIEFVLEENNIQAFTGSKYSVQRPNREVGVYSYMVTAKTIVNVAVKSVSTPAVMVKVGDVAPSTGASSQEAPLHKQVWFWALMAVLAAILLFIVILFIMKRCIRQRTVYIRERDPLPPRPNSKTSINHFRPSSRSTLQAGSEVFPNLHLSTIDKPLADVDRVTPNYYSSTRHLIEDNDKLDGTVLDQPIPDEDPSWDGFLKDYKSGVKEKNFSKLDESPSPDSIEQEEEDYGISKERILFPDTHL